MVALTPGMAAADRFDPLRTDPDLHRGLTVIAVGRHIQNVCPDISTRIIRAFTFAEALMGRATDMGFSRGQVKAYIESRADQARYREIARAYFAAAGADFDDVESVCRVGRDEISAGSAIGRLLRRG